MTRCSNKNSHIFPKVTQKSSHNSFNLKRLKSHHTFGLLIRENLTQRIFKNSPIWSHWSSASFWFIFGLFKPTAKLGPVASIRFNNFRIKLYFPTYLPTYLPTYSTYLPTYLPCKVGTEPALLSSIELEPLWVTSNGNVFIWCAPNLSFVSYNI